MEVAVRTRRISLTFRSQLSNDPRSRRRNLDPAARVGLAQPNVTRAHACSTRLRSIPLLCNSSSSAAPRAAGGSVCGRSTGPTTGFGDANPTTPKLGGVGRFGGPRLLVLLLPCRGRARRLRLSTRPWSSSTEQPRAGRDNWLMDSRAGAPDAPAAAVQDVISGLLDASNDANVPGKIRLIALGMVYRALRLRFHSRNAAWPRDRPRNHSLAAHVFYDGPPGP
ncbi:hypothetical protein N7532_004709 [Penicillium argentinense]|uniref:Uncharacterized protein n=1 Tax=Penicillium argentinense TaxID=1131581 RepID=A0A9W9FQJ4_9EURO|nr:uncharacterized protein N7532_004709 [Penicillium argentinense]KAJ5104180.1 hypothetical protein N7532_004709 [Penicillium argentinense]